MIRTSIDTGWTVQVPIDPAVPEHLRGRTVSATVPGCVHTDLLSAGLIDDPYLDDNEQAQHWIGDTTWRYATHVDVAPLAPGGRRELVFHGLDTVASIVVNGVEMARTANMHRRHRIDVTNALVPGRNRLEVVFESPRAAAAAVRARVGEYPSTYPEPFNYLRKMAANFGWDWGPTVVTSGIWKGVELVEWRVARLDSVRPQVDAEHVDGRWMGSVDLDLTVARSDDDAPLVARVRVAAHEWHIPIDTGASTVSARLAIDNPELWWPRGWGEPTLYDFEVTLERDDEELDRDYRRVGFRSATLITENDAHGGSFRFEINGKPIRIRGFNWIPADALVSRVGPDEYHDRIADAVAANANLLRVWGGGIYEKDEFYDICDELGVLVWQDFAFACAAYSEDELTWAEVRAEARDNVVRLISRPSLVLWNGNNENLWGFEDWGWASVLDGRPWGAGYYGGLLPSILDELDPRRAYTPGSPYSGVPDIHPNDPTYGTTHIWDVWNRVDYTHYADYKPRFVSEFGFQGPAQWATIRESLTAREIELDSPAFLAHQKAEDGAAKLLRGMEPHLPPPREVAGHMSFDDWHYLTQLNQARAIAFGVRHFRSIGEVCQGAIVWQLNDCWPATSWSAVDSAGRRKPVWYALRRAFAPLLVGLERAERPRLSIVNDGPTFESGAVQVRRVDVSGKTLAQQTVTYNVTSGETRFVDLQDAVAVAEQERRELIVADGPTGRTVLAFVEDVDWEFPPLDVEVRVEPAPGGLIVHVGARTLVRDLVLAADRIDADAVVDDQLVTLLPGESHSFAVSTSGSPTDVRWGQYPVVSAVNAIAAVNYVHTVID